MAARWLVEDAADQHSETRDDAVAAHSAEGRARRTRAAVRHRFRAHRNAALAAAATTAVLCADIGTIHAINSKARSDICEIELELHSGKIEPLFALASSLAADLPLSLEPASKAARGVHLVSPPHASPRHAENPELPRDVSASEALASIIRVCLRQIEGNIDGVLNDDDAEWIHQMRIGTRRLRACLSLVRDGADSDRLARLIGDVKRLACALGAVRDLDVLALETLPAVRQASRDDAATAAALRSFTAKVNHRRRIARTEARAAVASRRFVQTILAASAFAATPAHLAIRMSAREFASRLLARRQRKLLRRGAALPEGSAAQRHAARIAAKKLRYAAEFFSGLFPGRRARAYRKALTRLQDVLGALNDATVAVRLAREFAGPPSSAAATLQGWAATQSLAAAGELAHTWRDFSRCKPFWD